VSKKRIRFPKPFFRSSKNCWYVQFGKAQRSLGTADEAEALEQYKALLAEQDAQPKSVRGDAKVWQCFDLFLDHVEENHAERTYELYKSVLKHAARNFGTVRVRDLKVHHVTAWLRKKKEINDTTRAHHIGTVKAALNFCVKQGYVDRNPVAHMEKPTESIRDRILTDEERTLIYGSIRDEAFKDLLLAMQETGARPGEIAKLTAANINLDTGVIVWFAHKTAKKTKRPRVIYMTVRMREIIERRLAKAEEGGFLFVGRKGNPWNRHSFYSRFRRLRRLHTSLQGIVPYSFRTTYATEALEKGIPDTTVAELLGHTSPQVLHKHYSKLYQKTQHLKDAAEKARAS
jgi:integrase